MKDITNPYDEIDSPQVREQYYNGIKNQLIRIYYYLQQGLDLLNEFKYLGAGILAIYYLLNLEGYTWMVGMAVISIPILIIAGYFWTHKARKTVEYFSIKYTSHFQQYNIKIQERQLFLLEKLNKNIEDLAKKSK